MGNCLSRQSSSLTVNTSTVSAPSPQKNTTNNAPLKTMIPKTAILSQQQQQQQKEEESSLKGVTTQPSSKEASQEEEKKDNRGSDEMKIVNDKQVVDNGETEKKDDTPQQQTEQQVDDDNDPPEYLAQAEQAKAMLERYTLPLSKSDKVMVMQGWNKVLAFRTAFSEALLCHWRLLVTERHLNGTNNNTFSTDEKEATENTTTTTTVDPQPSQEKQGEPTKAKWASIRATVRATSVRTSSTNKAVTAMDLLETNQDPLAIALGVRLQQAEDLLIGLLDGAVRSLCPHAQVVQREAYRPIADDMYLARRDNTSDKALTTECETVGDYLALLTRCGVTASDWVDFSESFAWALATHTPYAQEDDFEDLQKNIDSAYRKMVVQLVSLPGIDAYADLRSLAYQELYQFHVRRFWNRHDQRARLGVGEAFYRTLLTKYPQLMDYFSHTDMDSLAAHLMMTIDLLVKSMDHLGSSTGGLREGLNALAKLHCRFRIATYNYMLVGSTLLEVLTPLFELEEQLTANDKKPAKKDELLGAFLRLYKEVMSIIYAPMIIQEKLLADAREFYRQIQEEFHWSEKQYEKRMMEIEEEVSASGTYTQTSKELEMGARLSWRNSAKCIGRISWNTLQVRDCRHVSKPREICQQVEEHLKIATARTNIQSVMTVFSVKKPSEMLGVRFWSSQYVRYAGYTQEDGSVLGDPANVELTDYLMERNYWDPPETRTAFDVLPLVIKSPGVKKPFVYSLPSQYVFEVDIEHPTNPKITALGYRWTTVPAISNFKMTLGGVKYQNIPFNGWFVSTEIVRNLMERYNAGPTVAKALGIDIMTHGSWRYIVAAELEQAVLHSFRKNKFTIVDPHSVGESFCVHVRREREHGRECPGQWSWIGGLTGPTNPTWHLEMRDFLIKPQYEYAIDDMALHTALEDRETATATVAETDAGTASVADIDSVHTSDFDVPRVLILYGSETGTAESVAIELKKRLRLLKPRLMTLNEAAGLEIVKKRRITHILCVCSTFGEGGPPSNAHKFFKTPLENDFPLTTKFAVLALGSTLYPDFCKAGEELDTMLLGFGLDQFMDLVKADEVAGGAALQMEWLDIAKRKLLPPFLEDLLRPHIDRAGDNSIMNAFNWAPEESTLTKATSGGSLCIENIKLTDTIQKITFEVPEQTSYVSGDHLVVYPVNRKNQVDALLGCFSAELISVALGSSEFDQSSNSALQWVVKQPLSLETFVGNDSEPSDVFFEMPTTLERVLESQIDLATRKSSFSGLIKFMKTRLDELLGSLEGNTDSLKKIKADPLVGEFLALERSLSGGDQAMEDITASFPNIVIFFSRFRPIFLDRFVETKLGHEGAEPLISLADFLVIAPRLQPRYYSISSSDKVSPDKVTITVGILTTKTSKDVPIEGVCSHYLASLVPGTDRAKIGIRKSGFRLPEKKDSPLIMVGAGTGLSPMMGFMQDRALDKKNGETVGSIDLFFGCRDESFFIYKKEISEYEKDGLLNLHLAMSRSQSMPKTYVQHKIEAMGKKGAELLLKKDTHYYVCGDARMANDCHEACVQLLRKYGEMSRVAAVHILNRMRMEGRWQTDVWGIVSHFESSTKKVRECRKAAAKIWLNQFTNAD